MLLFRIDPVGHVTHEVRLAFGSVPSGHCAHVPPALAPYDTGPHETQPVGSVVFCCSPTSHVMAHMSAMDPESDIPPKKNTMFPSADAHVTAPIRPAGYAVFDAVPNGGRFADEEAGLLMMANPERLPRVS